MGPTKFFEVILFLGEGSSSFTFTCSTTKVALHWISLCNTYNEQLAQNVNLYRLVCFSTFTRLCKA